MNIYRKRKATLFFLLLTTVCFVQTKSSDSSDTSGYLDLMVDFAYPISTMQSIRQDVAQAVYFLQSTDHTSVASMLQDALSKLDSRQKINQDDQAFIQEMLNKINDLIEALEEQDRAVILDLSAQLQAKL